MTKSRLEKHNFIIYKAQNAWVYDLMLYNITMKWLKNYSSPK